MKSIRMAPAILALALLAAAPAASSAQAGGAEAEASQDTVYHLVLSDGSSFYGRVESRDAERVVFVTMGGVRLELQRSQIRTLEPASGRVVGEEVWPRDPNGTRLFFGPTGRSLPSGEGYVGLFELFFSFGAVGIGDRVVLAAGTPVIPEVAFRVIYLAPKVRVLSTGSMDLAAGVLSFYNLEDPDQGSVGVLYGVGTLGDDDDAVTIGAGWGFALGAQAELSNDPVLLFGGEHRTSRRVKLITENYVFMTDDAFGFVTGGVRFLGDRFSADLGLGGIFGAGETFCCLPVLSASYTF